MGRRFGQGRGATFLKAEDLGDGNGGFRAVTVAIDDVEAHEFDDGSCYSLGFVGKRGRLRLNQTNEDWVIDAWGEPAGISGEMTEAEIADLMTPHLRGKTCVLWVDQNVRYQGKRVCGLRLRALEPVPAAVREEPVSPPSTADEIPF